MKRLVDSNYKNNQSSPSITKTKMTEIEKGIELTIKSLIKVKDDEIAELKRALKFESEILYEEIHQRDMELDKLRQAFDTYVDYLKI